MMAANNGIPELDEIQKKYFTQSHVEGELPLVPTYLVSQTKPNSSLALQTSMPSSL